MPPLLHHTPLVLSLLLLVSNPDIAGDDAASATLVEGTAVQDSGNGWKELAQGATVANGNKVKTDNGARLELSVGPSDFVRLNENTAAQVNIATDPARKIQIILEQGDLWEPTFHADLPLLVSEFKRKGLLVKLDTNGSNPQRLEQFIQGKGIDFVSMDVKAPLDSLSYQRAAGLPVDLNLIRKSIDILKKGEVAYQFRMTVVPGLLREEDAKRLGEQLRAGSRFILQNFNPVSPLAPSLNQTRPYDPGLLKKIEKEVQQMV